MKDNVSIFRESPQTGLNDGVRYASRQAIVDVAGRVQGYDLISRNEPSAKVNWQLADTTHSLLDQAFIAGLDSFTGGLAAFVACTEQTVTEQLIEVMPPKKTVLNFQVVAEPSSRLLASFGFLKAAGFRIALSRSWWEPQFEGLVEMADFLRVEFAPLSALRRAYLKADIPKSNAIRIACDVETQEDFRRARREGFTLFHGPFVCRPELLKNRTIQASRLAQIELLTYMRSPQVSMHELSKLVERDISLSYRLLRLVNSPMYTVRGEVRSIEGALLLVGQDAFQRILTLALAGELNSGGSNVVLVQSLVRARFCEQAARLCDLSPAEQYMVGMFSLLPVMLRISMQDLTAALPLRQPVCNALNGCDNTERSLLDWLESYESGDWELCDEKADAMRLNGQELADTYTQAVYWAEHLTQSFK